MGAKKKKAKRAGVLGDWLERDLTAERDELPPAFDVETPLAQLASVLMNGRSALVTGESGVGKTALVYELVRRIPDDPAFAELRDVRVLQLSFELRLAQIAQPHLLRQEMAKLADALAELDEDVIPFFRDIRVAYMLNLQPQLVNLCLRLTRPIIAEGPPSAIADLVEDFPELEESFVTLELDEPNLEQGKSILAQWSDWRGEAKNEIYDAEALEEGLYLAHRFISRTNLPRKAIDLLASTASTHDLARVDADAVIERFCAVHHTPRWLVDPKLPLEIEALEQRFRHQLLGQDDAVDAVLSMIAMLKAGLSDPRRPFGVFLFAGPTGVGKTHLAQLLAEELFGSRDRMVRINLGDYAGQGAVFDLFGNPNAHNQAARRGQLSRRIAGRPFAVLLLDEFEKATPVIYDRFLPLIDEGRFINGAGETVSCRTLIIVATSNAGAEVFRDHPLGFNSVRDIAERERAMERRIHETFRFELLNRFDRVVTFRPLTREEIRQVALRELERLKQRTGLRRRRIALDVDESVLDWLAVRGYDAEYGARFLKRTIERQVTTTVADAVVRAQPEEGEVIELYVRRNRIRARTKSPRRSAAEAAPHPEATPLERDPAVIVEAAAPLLAELQQHREERDELLAKMGEAGFWDDRDARERVLERFRELDVSVGIAERLAKPLYRLREELADPEFETRRHRGAVIGDAATALRRWEERRAVEGPSAVWLVLSGLDPYDTPSDWLLGLAKLERAWCRRSELAAAVEAFELRDGRLARLVFEVEGPGAAHFLAPEAGVHRRRRSGEPDHRVRIDVVPKGPKAEVEVRSCPEEEGPFGVRARHVGRLEIPGRGLAVTWHGPDASSLAQVIADLRGAWEASEIESTEQARSYGEEGGRAMDPRTGVSVAGRVVQRGQLDAFLDGYRRLR